MSPITVIIDLYEAYDTVILLFIGNNCIICPSLSLSLCIIILFSRNFLKHFNSPPKKKLLICLLQIIIFTTFYYCYAHTHYCEYEVSLLLQ